MNKNLLKTMMQPSTTTTMKTDEKMKSVGYFDLLPKCLYTVSNTEVYDDTAAFMWWGVYVVKCVDVTALPTLFVVVDNLDSDGLIFVVKDVLQKKPLLIKHGMQPAVFAENPSAAATDWYHLQRTIDMNFVKHRVGQLQECCINVRMVVNLMPFETLKIAKLTPK